MQLYPKIREHLLSGTDYAERSADGRFEFIKELVSLLARHPKFALNVKVPSRSTWEDILRWWLDPQGPILPPGAKRVSDWYQYVATNFSYRFAWGVGCILALATNDAHGDTLQPTTLDGWEKIGLPWIALWLKELIVWGTLDPVAAYVLGRGLAGTRTEAMSMAHQYFESHNLLIPNAQLDPSTIRQWASTSPSSAASTIELEWPLKATLARQFPKNSPISWRVLPTETGKNIRWIDPAGFALAISERPSGWTSRLLNDGDFFLDRVDSSISYKPFL
jgi:hypothetical protein